MFLCLSPTPRTGKFLKDSFFINGLPAEQRAYLIKICIQKCHNAGVDIIGLTFDGCAANMAAAELLGCQLHESNNLKTTFPQPCGGREVASQKFF